MRKRWIGALAAMLLLTGCGASQQVSKPKARPVPKKHVSVKTQTTQTLYSAVAVTIDNQPAAWPQSGLAEADLVFEFPAEGGITRYLAVFWHKPATKIGPVRSTRIYFDNVVAAYGWPLAHAGGNVDALKAIGPLGIKNLDQIYGSGHWFWRSASRPMPHNLYTSTNLLEQGIRQDGYTPAGIPALPQGRLTGQKTTGTLIIYANLPNVWVYEVGWVWQNGLYQRQIDGKDVVTQAGHDVTASNVVIIAAPEFPDPDPYTVGAINFDLTGGGKGYILSNGVRQDITWTFGQGGFHFYLPGGKAAPFAKGQTWVQVVPTGTQIMFQPGA